MRWRGRAASNESISYQEWARVINLRNGYASVYASETDTQKAIVEQLTALDWCQSMRELFDIELSNLQTNCSDPPDIWVWYGENRLGVELVEFVDGDHLARAKSRRPKNIEHPPVSLESPYSGKLFVDSQWTRNRFIEKLQAVIANKSIRYTEKGVVIDVLLIHTDEPWLEAGNVELWLSDGLIVPPENIVAGFLMFSYRPGEKPGYPLFHIFGPHPQRD